MDPFPSLAPTTRTYVPGDMPRTMQVALAGPNTGFRRGNRRIGQSLSMSFGHLTETQMNLVKNHYFNCQGTFDIFFLPSEIWGDFATPPVPLLGDYAWRYAAEPVIEDVSYNRFTVNVELVTYAIDFNDLIFDAGAAAAAPARTYILDAGAASATPARSYIINSGASR